MLTLQVHLKFYRHPFSVPIDWHECRLMCQSPHNATHEEKTEVIIRLHFNVLGSNEVNSLINCIHIFFICEQAESICQKVVVKLREKEFKT